MTLRSRLGRMGATTPILLARILALGGAFITAIVSAASLGPDGRGEVVAFAILQLIVATALGFGTGAAAYLLVGGDRHEDRAVAGSLAAWSGVVVVATWAVAGLAAMMGLLDQWLGTASGLIVAGLGLGAAAQYVVTGWTQLSMGLGRPWLAAAGFALAPIAVCVATLVVAAAGAPPEAYMLAQSGGWIGTAGAMVALAGVSPRWDPAAFSRVVRRGRGAILGDVANSLVYRLDVLLLGLLSGPAAVGVYSLAFQVLEPAWILATAAAGGLLVTFRRRARDLWVAMTIRSAVLTTGAAAAVVVLALVALPIMIAIVGSEFEPSIGAAIALAPGIVLLSAAKVLAAFQVASGRLWLSSAIATSCLVLTTVLDVVLMPTLGALGAAIASSIGYGAAALLWLVAFRRWSGAAAGVAGGAHPEGA